ncbi:uncharacterized protein CIMG_03949 [Coccidioides immitis RS]|uniref:Serine/threonine-protein kinase ppk6 n=3 Tax=Coccidioides immitis TaxID=5501 RepID=J3KCG0_COCIM|nr:uncharacterized protein CIMG_03949 [Coccidioides immitis RS]EAS32925.3 hypothetical protein CIMG_03949 [Coccidioides immitis RS]TPX19893.1 hypothetical protein DIZ76_017686 [Coccidioides immitis]
MSADLFAAFGNPKTLDNSVKVSSNSNSGSSSSGNRPKTWNSIVDAAGNSTLIDFSSEPHLSPFSQAIQDTSVSGAGSNEVLFDASTEIASNEATEDEWGEFESAKSEFTNDEPVQRFEDSIKPTEFIIHHGAQDKLSIPASKPRQIPLLDLLSTEDSNPPPQIPHRAPLALDCNVHDRYPIKQEQGDSEPTTAWLDFGEEDDWGEFTDGIDVGNKQEDLPRMLETATLPMQQVQSPSAPRSGVPKTKASVPFRTVARSPKMVRPTNIPPPSILLRLFPSLLEKLRVKATNYTIHAKRKAGPLPDTGPAEEITYSLKVMVHIIAGRSLRWKRDSILSQSIRIGPASGRPGGMKLSSVNKSENVREEKEAVEVLDIWKKCNGLLNSAASAGGKSPVQFVAGNLQVRTATTQEGALKAPHACALCGLRREERVSKIDENVDDIFEEWWTEHWGHSDCKRFWEANSMNLDQR